MMLHQDKELPNDSGRPQNWDDFTNKKAKWLLLRSHAVLLLLLSSPIRFQSPRFQKLLQILI